MKKFRLLLCAFLLLMAAGQTKGQAVLKDDPLYQLVFFDEFDSLGLDTAKWFTIFPWGTNLWNNNTVNTCTGSGFTPDGVVDVAVCRSPPYDANNRSFDTTGSGFQRLTMLNENVNADVFAYNSSGQYTGTTNKPFKFTTAMLRSRYNFKYCYVEMKYRLSNYSISPDNAYGPNFWMLNTDSSATSRYSELDVFEMDGTLWKMGANMHYRKRAPEYPTADWRDTAFFDVCAYPGNPTDSLHPYLGQLYPVGGGNYNGGTWHTVACDWTPDYADFFYDTSDTVRRFSNNLVPVRNLNPLYLIIDSYMPAFQFCIPFDTINTQPLNYDIDFVKVYQVRQNCINQFFLNTSSATYISTLYRNLTIGGSGGSAVFSNGNHHLAGQDFVLLQEGFAASGTATVMVSTPSCQDDQAIIYNSVSNPTPPPYNQRTFKDLKKAKTDE